MPPVTHVSLRHCCQFFILSAAMHHPINCALCLQMRKQAQNSINYYVTSSVINWSRSGRSREGYPIMVQWRQLVGIT